MSINTSNTFSAAFVWFTVVLIIAGVVIGLTLKSAGPATPLKAEELDQGDSSNPSLFETTLAAFKGQAELVKQVASDQQALIHKAESERAELAAQAKEHELDLTHAQERHQLEMAQMRSREELINTLMVVGTATLLLAGLIVAIGTVYYCVIEGRCRMLIAQAQLVQSTKSQHAEAVRRAREAERQWRAAQYNGNGNGHKQEWPTLMLEQN